MQIEKERIVIVEDDPKLAQLITEFLQVLLTISINSFRFFIERLINTTPSESVTLS